MELEIGKMVYLKPMGNQARYSKEIEEAKVSKIGRKYFQIVGNDRSRFSIEEMLHDGGQYSPQWQVYFSKKEIEDEIRCSELNKKISDIFHFGNSELTLKQLEEIDLIANQ